MVAEAEVCRCQRGRASPSASSLSVVLSPHVGNPLVPATTEYKPGKNKLNKEWTRRIFFHFSKKKILSTIAWLSVEHQETLIVYPFDVHGVGAYQSSSNT